LTSCPVLFVPPHFGFFFYPSADSRTMWALHPVATGLAYIIIPILNMEDFIISRDITIRTVPETVNTAGSNFCRFHWTLSLCPSTLKLHPTPLCCFTGSRVFIKRINPNSTTWICCGFVVQQAVQQIHNKSKALYNKSWGNAWWCAKTAGSMRKQVVPLRVYCCNSVRALRELCVKMRVQRHVFRPRSRHAACHINGTHWHEALRAIAGTKCVQVSMCLMESYVHPILRQSA